MDGNRLWVLVAALVTAAASVFAIVAATSSSDSGGGSAAGTTAAPPSGSAAPTTGTATIEIAEFAFGPQELTVQAGTVVTWANEDGVGHSIKSGDGSFDSPDFGQGETFSFTFNEPGTFPYVCGIHDSMTGTVVVEG